LKTAFVYSVSEHKKNQTSSIKDFTVNFKYQFSTYAKCSFLSLQFQGV